MKLRRDRHRTTTDVTRQPLLDRPQLAGLIRQGRQLARAKAPARASAGRHGGRPAPPLGDGTDFAEHRAYRPGDDVRRIDWRASARIGAPQLRRYHEERTAPCVLVVDRRASMRFATRGRLKVTQAVRLAVLLAALYTAREVPLWLLVLDHDTLLHGPLDGSRVLPWALQLAAPAPPAAAPEPGLAGALLQLQRRVQAGARLLLLSDLADACDVAAPLWQRLSRQYQVSAVLISDVAEQQLPGAPTAVSLCWPSTAGEHCVPLDSALRRRVLQQGVQQRAQLRAQLGAARIDIHPLASDEASLLALAGRLAR